MDGRPVEVRRDALGFMLLQPQCSGACSIELEYVGSLERRALAVVSGAAALGLLLALIV